jgi:acyl-CoA synthetase (AMP-forming)/AMP-acid ligase II
MIRHSLIQPVGRLIRKHAAERPAKIAYEDARSAVTYAELDARTARLAGWLQANGHVAGERVALLIPNGTDWIIGSFATSRAGCISVPISNDSTEPEIRYRLEDAACRTVIVSPQHVALVQRLQAELPSLRAIVVAGPEAPAGAVTLPSVLATDPGQAPRDPDNLDDTAYIVYTSGTTGRAKGVMLTQRSMLWVIAACWVPIAGLSERDVILSPLPLFHSYALNLSVLGVLAVGATEHILERYSTQDVTAKLESGRFTLMPGVPTMFHYLLESRRDRPAGRIPGVRMFISAGAIMPATLNRDFEAKLGVPLCDGYGITETATMVTMNWPDDTRVMGSCGLPLPGLAVRLVALDGTDVPQGEEGELIVRGPNLMQGYLNKPKETGEALRKGWYHTGDLARADANGYLTITGRLKELIIRGGQNIAPAEVEEAVLTHAPVLDCAVIGMPHPHLGEVPVACVVPREGATIDREALVAHCAKLLSAYKLPAEVRVVKSIPRTGSGKIMRYKLREQLNA